MTSPQVTGPQPARYQTGQLVVALEHCGRVAEVLALAGADPIVERHSEPLGLALLTFTTDPRVLTRWLRGQLGTAGSRIREHAYEQDLGPLLAALRAWFAARHAGWCPTMGKNRLVGSVTGGDGIVSHGGSGMPSPLPKPLPPRTGRAGEEVTVGVLDTGIAEHPWLAGGWTGQRSDMLPGTAPYRPEEGHATFIAGLVLSQAPAATVRVHRLLTRPAVADCWSTANAIVEFGRSGLDILNLSFVCYTEDGEAPLALSQALHRIDPDLVVVAAAGNHGTLQDGTEAYRPAFPAALDEVVAVGAVDRDRRIAAYTPRDADWVDVVALGTDVPSTYLTGQVYAGDAEVSYDGWASWTGTSFAAGLVSGAIAARTVPGRVTAREAFSRLRARGERPLPRGDEPWLPPLLSLDPPYETP
jgi:subtilisin family serine protease